MIRGCRHGSEPALELRKRVAAPAGLLPEAVDQGDGQNDTDDAERGGQAAEVGKVVAGGHVTHGGHRSEHDEKEDEWAGHGKPPPPSDPPAAHASHEIANAGAAGRPCRDCEGGDHRADQAREVCRPPVALDDGVTGDCPWDDPRPADRIGKHEEPNHRAQVKHRRRNCVFGWSLEHLGRCLRHRSFSLPLIWSTSMTASQVGLVSSERRDRNRR